MTSQAITRRPQANDYERTIQSAHAWHRIAQERKALQDERGAAEAATFALVCAATADPLRERPAFATLREECLTIQRAWFKPVPKRRPTV